MDRPPYVERCPDLPSTDRRTPSPGGRCSKAARPDGPDESGTPRDQNLHSDPFPHNAGHRPGDCSATRTRNRPPASGEPRWNGPVAARAEAQRIREEAARSAEAMRARELEQARAEAERLRSDAAAEIERSRAQVAEEIRGHTAELVLSATSRVLDRAIDGSEHRRIVEEAIAEVSVADKS